MIKSQFIINLFSLIFFWWIHWIHEFQMSGPVLDQKSVETTWWRAGSRTKTCWFGSWESNHFQSPTLSVCRLSQYPEQECISAQCHVSCNCDPQSSEENNLPPWAPPIIAMERLRPLGLLSDRSGSREEKLWHSNELWNTSTGSRRWSEVAAGNWPRKLHNCSPRNIVRRANLVWSEYGESSQCPGRVPPGVYTTTLRDSNVAKHVWKAVISLKVNRPNFENQSILMRLY